ncbi:MAG: TRAP transporter small permease subunit [Deltaproteobacteria bacterium]|nr:TRAP transporter small permease subunit [Deltaproteobacteria bacterium]
MSPDEAPLASGAEDIDPRRLGEQSDITHHTALPHTRTSKRLDASLMRCGEILSWIWLLLLAVIVSNVTLRYVFGEGRVELEELQWHLYAVGFLGGLSYCVPADAHIRVDFLRDRLSPRMQAWVELYGILLLLLPFCGLVLVFAVPFVAESWASGEVSPSPGGLPARWLIKAALPIGAALLTIAYVSRLLRVSSLLFGAPAPLPRSSAIRGEDE